MICGEISDPRIIYRRNQRNLGVGRNIDAAFSMAPLHDTEYLCVLEDDNFYLPDNLAANVLTLRHAQADVVLRNQLIETPTQSHQDGRVGPETTLDGQYQDGLLTREELWATFFYSTAAINSSLFWRAGAGLTFSTADYSPDPIFQERLRTLRIDRDVVMAMEPKIVWRANIESARPRARGLSWYIEQAKSARRERHLYRALYAFLSEQGVADLVWRNRHRTVSGAAERVFWAVRYHA